MSVEKILEKLLRGESDANIRFEELCHLLQGCVCLAATTFSRNPV
jgi:hypothetical protein